MKLDRSGNTLISVIVPYYNNPELFECIDSILRQRYPAIELIVADDGSAEDLSEQIGAYVQEKQTGNISALRILRSDSNRGTVQNINNAVEAARGDPIFTVSADDVLYDSGALEDWTKVFAEEDAEIVIGCCAECDSGLRQRYVLPDDKQRALILSGDSRALWKKLRRGNFILGCATARSAEAVRKYGPVPECYRYIEDYPMNLRWARLGARIRLADRNVIMHRGGGVSAADRVNDQYIDDTEQIYRNEIIPFSAFPAYWKIHMRMVILGRKREGRYIRMRRRHSSLIWNIYCHLRYPEIFIRYIRSHL